MVVSCFEAFRALEAARERKKKNDMQKCEREEEKKT